MTRVELRTQILRIRTLIALLALLAVPAIAGLTSAGNAGHRNGTQTGLFGASTYSALNHSAASLAFIGPLLLPLVIALLSTAIGASDKEWGTLRYLYVRPVSRGRLVVGKFTAMTIAAGGATGCVIVGGLLTGVILFGWHPFHILGTPNLSAAQSDLRFLAASGYTALCMLSIGSIALMLGLLMPRAVEALGVSVAFVVVASILNGQASLHPLNVILPVHYWQDWTTLFAPGTHTNLTIGILDQVATTMLASAVAIVALHRRDPAA